MAVNKGIREEERSEGNQINVYELRRWHGGTEEKHSAGHSNLSRSVWPTKNMDISV